MRQEIPPTAGLPLRLTDFLPPWRAGFAQQAADYAGLPHVGLACSGTASLIIILRSLRQHSARKNVVIPAYTCPLVVLAIAHCGLQTRLCDLAPNSLDMDTVSLAAVCDTDTLAIIPTHLAGRVASIAPVKTIAEHCGAFIVEDAAQAFGATNHGQSVGLAGDAGFFSFAAGKGLSLYEGGVWTTRSPQLAEAFSQTAAQMLPERLWFELRRSLEMLAYATLYHPTPLRLAYGAPLRRGLRQGNLAEAVGDVFSPNIPLHRVSAWRQSAGFHALSRLRAFHEVLAGQAYARCEQLRQLPDITVLQDAPDSKGVWPSLFLILPDQKSRDAALTELWGAGLGVTRMFVNALPDYAYLAPWLAPSDCATNARDFAARTLTISNSPWLDNNRFEQIVSVLNRHV
jgi:perosamine synthetase